MDRPTYNAKQAMLKRDSAARDLRLAQARLDEALAAWLENRPSVSPTMASRDAEATIRNALLLTGELPVASDSE